MEFWNENLQEKTKKNPLGMVEWQAVRIVGFASIGCLEIALKANAK